MFVIALSTEVYLTIALLFIPCHVVVKEWFCPYCTMLSSSSSAVQNSEAENSNLLGARPRPGLPPGQMPRLLTRTPLGLDIWQYRQAKCLAGLCIEWKVDVKVGRDFLMRRLVIVLLPSSRSAITNRVLSNGIALEIKEIMKGRILSYFIDLYFIVPI